MTRHLRLRPTRQKSPARPTWRLAQRATPSLATHHESVLVTTEHFNAGADNFVILRLLLGAQNQTGERSTSANVPIGSAETCDYRTSSVANFRRYSKRFFSARSESPLPISGRFVRVP
jgi:hypothetical protein